MATEREAATPTQDDRVRYDNALRQIWATFDDWSEQEKGLARTVWWHANRAALASPAGTAQPTTPPTPASEAVVQDAARELPDEIRERIDAALECALLWTKGAEVHPLIERVLADFRAALRSLPQQPTGERE